MEQKRDPVLEEVLKRVQIHLITDGEGTFRWIHTHGMEHWGLPNLEIRGVPMFLGPEATGLLNHIACYMVESQKEGKFVVPGERMQTGPMQIFEFVTLPPIEGQEDHFEYPRLALSDAPMRSVCGHPDHG